MKRLLGSLLVLLLGNICTGQNYNCVQPGVKRYFINGDGYLRGIRVDSVKVVNGDTVLYPFRMARGAIDPMMLYSVLDSNGGHWLGKTITHLPDGTTLCRNFLNDTIVIKTQAGIGNTWTFYNDSGSVHFDATVTSTDTMTVLGVLDSIKRISIVAKDAANQMLTDSLNGFPIVISKNHGFVTVFDLYCFPYRMPDSSLSFIDNWMDYHMINIRNVFNSTFQPANLWKIYIFSIADYRNPSSREIFDFNVGDKFQWTRKYIPHFGFWGWENHCTDTIFGKTTTATTTSYNWHRNCGTNAYLYQPQTVSDTDFLNLVDRMPEEFPENLSYVYRPNDTTLCHVGNYYGLYFGSLSQGRVVSGFERTYIKAAYKVGLGNIFSYIETEDAGSWATWTNSLTWYQKGNDSCGRQSLAVPEQAEGLSGLRVYPNPVSDFLEVKAPVTGMPVMVQVSLIDVFGRVVQRLSWDPAGLRIDVSSLPSGVYQLLFVAEAGGQMSRKVVIQH